MFKPDIKADMTAVGGIFTLIILLSSWLYQQHNINKQLTNLQYQVYQTKEELYAAKVVAVELDQLNTNLHNTIIELNKAYDEQEAEANHYRKLSNLKESLRQYSIEDQAIGLALAWTESNWDYKAKHKSSARGICGVMPLWDPYLAELNINPNSVEACIAIYNFYLDQTESKTKAIKEYKGIESKKHMWLVHRTLEVKQHILHKLKEQ